MSATPADLTRHVLAVLAHGLSLKDRLAAGEALQFETENAAMVQMLWCETSVRGHPEYEDKNLPRPVARDTKDFLGVRYALACWVDEIFISDLGCKWQTEWLERAVEPQIYGGAQQRGRRFWEQAELVERGHSAEAIEAFLWCVMLGFRGVPKAGFDPVKWAERVRERVLTARQVQFRLPTDRNIRMNVPPLRGRDKFVAAARALLVAAAAALFVVSMVVVDKLFNAK